MCDEMTEFPIGVGFHQGFSSLVSGQVKLLE